MELYTCSMYQDWSTMGYAEQKSTKTATEIATRMNATLDTSTWKNIIFVASLCELHRWKGSREY